MNHNSKNRPYDVLAVGGVDIDIVMTVDSLPGHGEKVMGRFVGRLPGGTVGNFACAAGQLGLRVASFATVGADEAGRLVTEDFARFGVSTDFVERRADTETHFTVILIEPSGERSIVVVPMFEETLDMERARIALPQVRSMYAMPHNPDQFIRLAGLARELGVLVMIDVESTIGADRATLERMLAWVDIASFNEAGLIACSGEAATVEGARQLLAYGPRIVAVTLGSRGSLAVSANEVAEEKGFTVPVRDTTGAGDTFNAAFLTATLRGDALGPSLAYANAAAAISVSGLGPRGHLPTHEEVERLMGGNRG